MVSAPLTGSYYYFLSLFCVPQEHRAALEWFPLPLELTVWHTHREAQYHTQAHIHSGWAEGSCDDRVQFYLFGF